MNHDPILAEMKLVFKDVPYGIEHTLRVLQNASEIAAGETAAPEIVEVISLAAILHDIGAVEAQRKYNSMDGRFQELEGPDLARAILERAGADEELIERVSYIVGHHHTLASIDGLDFQILWEADFLDNLEFGEGAKTEDEVRRLLRENFKTATGRKLALKRCGQM